ncbi:uncharacterized protein LOC122502390 [Leptopilina heterotoma]|uniref:uncharacterized protein LOC122502390 n=1 Tax=Leptopilina heterotoma TaxID=63436 RepID=UPI001CA897AF|nr:uncharacterized protein LOC122502390 [Leptopilina heterotoma]
MDKVSGNSVYCKCIHCRKEFLNHLRIQQLQPQVEEYVPKNVTYRWTRWDVPRFIEVLNTQAEVYQPTPRELLRQTANPNSSSNNSTSEVVNQPVDDFRYEELLGQSANPNSSSNNSTSEVVNQPVDDFRYEELLGQSANPNSSSNNSTSEVVSQPVDDFRYDELFEELFGQEDLETAGDLLALEEAVTIDEIFNMSEEIIQEYEFPVVANLAQENKEDVIEMPSKPLP